MALDLTKYPAATRLQQIKLGEQFGSGDTLDQANQTLNAAATYGPQIAAEGFVAIDIETLTGARDGLQAAGVGRDTAKGQKLATSKGYVDVMVAAQALRLRARSVLEGTLDDLEGIDTPAAAEAARKVGSALSQTAVAGADAEARAKQLDLLGAVMVADGVKDAAKARGSDEVVPSLASTSAALRAAKSANTGVPGTPTKTQTLDQLDGIIVRLVRRARKAAIAASKNLGDPAIAKAFKLDKLYRSRGGSAAEEVEGEDAEGATDAGGAATPGPTGG